MASLKRLSSVCHSIAHHAASGLSFVHPHLRRACREAGLDSLKVSLISDDPCPERFRQIEPLRLSLLSLRARFEEILQAEGFKVFSYAVDYLGQTTEQTGSSSLSLDARPHPQEAMNNIIRTVVVLLSACAIECRGDGAESERQAVVALEACAPAIELDESKPGKPVIAVRFRPNAGRVTDDDLVHLKAFPDLRSVELPNKSRITDLGLSHLGGLARLEELNLNGTKVSAAAVVEFVKGRTNLQRLELTSVPLHDDDLAALKDLTALRALSLRESLITDRGLAHLKRLTKLRLLSLMSTSIGDAGLEHLKALAELEDLDLDATLITDAGLKHLKALRQLRRLQVAYTAVTDAGLQHLETLSNLEGLNTRRTKVTPEALARLKQRLPGLK